MAVMDGRFEFTKPRRGAIVASSLRRLSPPIAESGRRQWDVSCAPGASMSSNNGLRGRGAREKGGRRKA